MSSNVNMSIIKDTKDQATVEKRRWSCQRSEFKTQTLVLVSAFFCQMISLGFAFSLGVFYVEFVSSFPVGRGAVSWATSLCSGFLFGAGLVVGLCIQRAGPRVCSMLGGIVAFAGVLSSSFVQTLPPLYITFGVINGFGLCLAQLSSAVAIGHHFTKGRAAATSISAVGAGIGSLVFPVLLRFLIDFYHWRGALMIFSGVVLNLVPCGLLFAPKQHKTLKQVDNKLHQQAECSVTELPDTERSVHIDEGGNVSNKSIQIEPSQAQQPPQNDPLFQTQNEFLFQNVPAENASSIHKRPLNEAELPTQSEPHVRAQTNPPVHEVPSLLTESEAQTEVSTQHRHTFCDTTMWRNSLYVIYLCIAPIISTGYSFPYVALVDLGVLRGFDKSRSTWLIIYISITTAVCTFAVGLLLKLFHKHAIQFFNLSLVLMGSVLFIFPSLLTYTGLVCGAVAYGIAMGGLTGTYAIIVVDMIGLNLYATGFGFVCTGYGIGYLLGTPVAGWITDFTGSYDTSFYIAGSLCLGPALIFIIAQLALYLRHRQSQALT